MSKDDIVFSWLREDEMADFADLHNKCFGANVSDAYLIHKSFGWRGTRRFLAAKATYGNNQLLGVMALYPRRFSLNGRELFSLEAADSMVAPEARGRSVFSRLISYVFNELESDDCEFIYGFPNPAAQPGWRKAGVGPLLTVTRYYAPLGMGSFIARRRRELSFIKKAVDYAFIKLNEIRGSNTQAGRELIISPFEVANFSGFESALGCFERSYAEDELRSRYEWAKRAGIRSREYVTADVRFSGRLVLRAVIGVEEQRSAHVFELRAADPGLFTDALSVLRRRAPSILGERFGQTIEYLAIDIPSAPARLTNAVRQAGFFERETYGRVFFKLMKSSELAGVVPEQLFVQLADSDAL
jgi:Acetyltransferase (GNAT) domain